MTAIICIVDDVVNGIISNNNGYTYYSSAYYAGDKISLSKEAAEKLGKNVTIRYY